MMGKRRQGPMWTKSCSSTWKIWSTSTTWIGGTCDGRGPFNDYIRGLKGKAENNKKRLKNNKNYIVKYNFLGFDPHAFQLKVETYKLSLFECL